MTDDAHDSQALLALEVLHSSSTWELLRARRRQSTTSLLLRRPRTPSPLRLAELHVLEARTRAIPVLLLDDVSSELDRERTARLFKLVAALGAQVFVTTTDPAIAAMLPGARRFAVADGAVTPASAG